LSSLIQSAKDLDAPLRPALRAHEKPPAAGDNVRIEWPPRIGDTAGPMFHGELVAYLRHRSSRANELVLEPKPLEVHRTGATALRLSRVMALAALVAWALVSLPGIVSHRGTTPSILR
jgi:hypothetical protein